MNNLDINKEVENFKKTIKNSNSQVNKLLISTRKKEIAKEPFRKMIKKINSSPTKIYTL